ncbi:hypothetical protein B1218_35430, partial [Pseudomonas ogarae]
MGQPMGERVLQEVATRIEACTRQNEGVASLGGDEFGR